MKGSRSFLTTRPAAEAWVTVQQMMLEEGCVMRRVAKRLGVHEMTLWNWVRKNDLRSSVAQTRADYLKKEIE